MILLIVGVKVLLLMLIFMSFVLVLMRSMIICYCFLNGEEYSETTSAAVMAIGNYLITHKRGNSLFYDLGSSQGDFLFRLLKICNNLRTVGIERDRIKIFYAHMQNIFPWNKGSPVFLRKDFMTADISKVDVVFMYVPRVLLPQLQEKLQRELKNKGIVILYKISFLDWSPIETIDTDYVEGDLTE